MGDLLTSIAYSVGLLVAPWFAWMTTCLGLIGLMAGGNALLSKLGVRKRSHVRGAVVMPASLLVGGFAGALLVSVYFALLNRQVPWIAILIFGGFWITPFMSEVIKSTHNYFRHFPSRAGSEIRGMARFTRGRVAFRRRCMMHAWLNLLSCSVGMLAGWWPFRDTSLILW
ncbi:MAG: hypothetical protein AAF747_03955 [Planctomycetota bacterium]